MNKIDIVYTWVDGSDKNWLAKKEYYQKKYKNNNASMYSSVNGRFRSSNEIIYGIRSIEKFFPNHGKIFIVTDNQKVSGLNEQLVNYVDHSEILNDRPTYSSKKIESNLFKIKNLSDNFLYFNDDILLGPLFKLEDFYADNKYYMHFEKSEESDSKFPPSVKLNSIKSISRHFPDYLKRHIDLNFNHAPRFLNKGLIKLLVDELHIEYSLLQKEIFRESHNLSMISDTFYRWLHAKNLAIKKDVNYVYVECKNKKEDFNELIEKFNNISYFCINDTTDDTYPLDYRLNVVEEVLDSLFPQKSRYEI